MTAASRNALMPSARITGGLPSFKDARKELGLGQPPDCMGDANAAQFLADQCDPRCKITIVEVARGRVDLGVPDAAIPTTFGNRLNVFGQIDGNPPPGFTTLTNTLSTPGLIASDMIIRGWSIRVLVEPEARTIPINFLQPGATTNIPGSPDAMTDNDIENALGLANDQSILPGDLLWGLPTWKAAYAFMNAYEGVWLKTHQDAILKDPLTQMATIEPFAEAEAAGLAFTTNQDRILNVNQRLVQLGFTQQCMPIWFKRLGCLTASTEGTPDVGDFIVSREDDASPTIFGGIGVPTNRLTKDPYLFTRPVFWPAGIPMSFVFEANDTAYLSDFQRWLSVTGGTNGEPGLDLSLPWSSQPNLQGALSPSNSVNPFMLEQSLDPSPVNVPQQSPTRRALVKGGAMVFEVGLIGMRVSQPWKKYVAAGIAAGAFECPVGYGSLQVPGT